MPPPTPRYPVPFQPSPSKEDCSPAPIPSLFRSVGQPMAHHALWVTTSRVRHGKRQRNSPGGARAAGNRVSDSRAILPLGVEDLVHDLGILDAAMIRCPQYMRQRSGIHTRLVTAQGRKRLYAVFRTERGLERVPVTRLQKARGTVLERQILKKSGFSRLFSADPLGKDANSCHLGRKRDRGPSTPVSAS